MTHYHGFHRCNIYGFYNTQVFNVRLILEDLALALSKLHPQNYFQWLLILYPLGFLPATLPKYTITIQGIRVKAINFFSTRLLDLIDAQFVIKIFSLDKK